MELNDQPMKKRYGGMLFKEVKMSGAKRFFPFKYKLVILLFMILFLAVSLLGIFQSVIIRKSLEESFRQNQKLIHDRVLNMIQNADYVNMLYEKPIEAQAREILDNVREYYDSNKDISIDLNSFLEGNDNYNLYIIDSNNTIIAATDDADLGLDFSQFTDFVQYLDEVRTSGEFASDRVSLSINAGDLMKFCYLPSSDGEYIFETGSRIEYQDSYASNVDFNDFEHRLLEENSFVSSIMLYDYQGVSYKKDEYNNNIKVDTAYGEFFAQALESMETVRTAGYYEGIGAYYEYIPYEIMEAKGVNERNVIEIIYNDLDVRERLRQNNIMIIGVVMISAVIAAFFGYLFAGRLTKPVEALSEGVKQVAAGNLSYTFRIDMNDELSLLGNQFNHMTEEIRKLLEERYRFENDLQVKNQEIFTQKEEITALYEETTALNEELQTMLQQNINSYFETVRALANAIDEKDSYTGGHCERVMEYSMIIARELGLNQYEQNDLKFGSILHDIGKIGISENILNKEGKLTGDEYEEIKRHPVKGNNILRDLNFLNNCRRIINEHHERIDGNGYPNGLSDDRIYFLARIVCVADAYDAMTSSRPYRKNTLSREQAIEELINNSGTQFDTRVVEAFVNYLRKKQVLA